MLRTNCGLDTNQENEHPRQYIIALILFCLLQYHTFDAFEEATIILCLFVLLWMLLEKSKTKMKIERDVWWKVWNNKKHILYALCYIDFI